MAQWHQIRGNETIGSIAGMYGATPFQLLGANPGMGNTLAAGSYLRVPTVGSLNVGTGVGGYSTQQLNAKQLGFGTTQYPSPIGPPAPPVPGTGSFLTGAGTPRLPQSATPSLTPTGAKRPTLAAMPAAPTRPTRGNPYEAMLKTYKSDAFTTNAFTDVINFFNDVGFIDPARVARLPATLTLAERRRLGTLVDTKDLYDLGYMWDETKEEFVMQAGQAGQAQNGKVYVGNDTYLYSSQIGGRDRRKGESYFNPKTGNWRTNGAGRRRDTTADNNGGDGGTARKANTMTMNVGWRFG